MPSVFTLIGESWNFCRKQPALSSVGFWLLFLPLTGINWCMSYIQIAQQNVYGGSNPLYFLASLCLLPLGVLLMWGISCVLVIGSRLLAAKAGRSRTSFKAVRTEAKAFVIPLILTTILRNVMTILWAILFIIPGIIYYVRTIFYVIIIVDEGMSYRPALHRSRDIVKGHTGDVFIKILLISIFLFAPIRTVIAIFTLVAFSKAQLMTVDMLDAALTSGALTLFTICTILLYQSMRPGKKMITNTKIKTVKRKKKMFA